jgi:hypothetical protein
MPQKGLVDPNLDALIRHIANIKKEAFEKRTNNEAVPWSRPPLEEWDGDLQTEGALIDMHKAFNTDKAEEALIEAFTPGDAGNSSDGIVLSLQIDYAAQAERAFRARNTQTFPRALAHYSTREKGHGQDNGALIGQALDYFTHIIKQGSEGSGGSV